MENSKEELKQNKFTNKMKWIIFVVIFMVVLTGSTAAYFIINSQNSKQTVAQEQYENEVQEQNTVSMEQLENVENKTEEELQKLNEEEMKKAEEKENQNKNNTSSTTSKKKYYIKVNYGAQLIDVYTYDSNGKYTKRVKTFICSTGTATPTSGVYKIPAKITWLHMFGDVYGHYCTQIVGNILFHSVPYLVNGDPSTLEYWEYDKLGTKASMGCIRMTTADALWIFNNVSVGSSVEFYSDPSQAYRRPKAQKISSAPAELRGWDPTDPNPKNPWKTYKAEDDKKEDDDDQKEEQKPEDTTKPQNPSSGSNTETPGESTGGNEETENGGNEETTEPGGNEETTKPGGNEETNPGENEETPTGGNEQENTQEGNTQEPPENEQEDNQESQNSQNDQNNQDNQNNQNNQDKQNNQNSQTN